MCVCVCIIKTQVQALPVFTFHDGVHHHAEQVLVPELGAQQRLGPAAALQPLHGDDQVDHALHGQRVMGNLQLQTFWHLGLQHLALAGFHLRFHLFFFFDLGKSCGKTEQMDFNVKN